MSRRIDNSPDFETTDGIPYEPWRYVGDYEPDFEQMAADREEARWERIAPWYDDPMFDGTPHRGQVPDHLATGYVQ